MSANTTKWEDYEPLGSRSNKKRESEDQSTLRPLPENTDEPKTQKIGISDSSESEDFESLVPLDISSTDNSIANSSIGGGGYSAYE